MTDHFHTIVIGAGSGGLTVAIGLAGFGKQVAFIEGHHVGGDCTNVGCVPSKTLIHLAKNFEPGMNPDEALRQVTRKRDALREKETEEVKELKNVTLFEGWATFTAPREIEVEMKDGSMRKLSAPHIVIATGSHPRFLDIPGLPKERMLTNESLFDLRDLPKHLVIAGAGIVAMEMAFAFRKLGSQVTIFTSGNRPLSDHIPEVAEAMQPEMEKKGIVTHYGARAKSFYEATKTLTIKQNDTEIDIKDVDKVLIAIGRVRNLESLGLERAGVKWDAKTGVAVNSYGESNVKGVYAIGDVTPTSAFTHSANAQGRRVTQGIAFPYLPLAKQEPMYPTATFSDPEVANVGLTQKQIAEKYHPKFIRRIRVNFKDHTDRGYTDSLEHGFIIADVVRLTGQILHVTIVGPRASEMISFFTLAMTQKISLYKIYRLVYPYPTFSSGILKVADFFIRETLPNIRQELTAFVKYRFANG